MFGRSVTMLAALSLAASPAFAQASDLSLARVAAPTEAASDLNGAGVFPAILFAAIVVGGVLLATGVLFDDDDPSSP